MVPVPDCLVGAAADVTSCGEYVRDNGTTLGSAAPRARAAAGDPPRQQLGAFGYMLTHLKEHCECCDQLHATQALSTGESVYTRA